VTTAKRALAHVPQNNAFKLTSASRVEALRATTRGMRSQLNAMFDGPRRAPMVRQELRRG
jgi:esterase/lipase superfamily enzyme